MKVTCLFMKPMMWEHNNKQFMETMGNLSQENVKFQANVYAQ